MKKDFDAVSNYLVQSYEKAEIDSIINAIKDSLEFNLAVIKNHKKWTWKKGSTINDLSAFTRTLLSLGKSYSLREISSLLNADNGTLRKKMDYSLVMDTVQGRNRDRKNYKYSLSFKNLTMSEMCADCGASFRIYRLNATEKLLARDILSRVRANNMSVAEFLSSTSEEILNSIGNTPMNYSSMLLREVVKKSSLGIAFSKARLAIVALSKGYSLEWFNKNCMSNATKVTKNVVEEFTRTYLGKLNSVMKNPVVVERKISGSPLKWSETHFYYEYKNGKTGVVDLETVREYIKEEVFLMMSKRYREELYKVEREMEVR